MTWLKKFGLDLLKIVGVVAGIEPMITPMLPAYGQSVASKVTSDLTLISNAVQTAEGMFAAVSDPSQKLGSEKLKAATPFVSQVVQQWISSGQLGSKKIKNETLFESAVSGITSNMADLLNSLGD